MSSISIVLYFGRFSFIRLHSKTNASISLSTMMYSKWSISEIIFSIFGLRGLVWKYEDTRLFRLIAFPTYMILSALSCMIYTPGLSGSFLSSCLTSNINNTLILLNRKLYTKGNIIINQRPASSISLYAALAASLAFFFFHLSISLQMASISSTISSADLGFT